MSDERVNTGSAELRGSITPFSGMLFYRGALAITGTLEVSGERLHFEPKGWLDLLVGVGQKWEMALSAVDRVEVRGLLDKRLFITSGEETFSFGGRDLETCFDAIATARAMVPAARDAASEEAEAVRVLGAWAETIGLDPEVPPLVRAVNEGVLRGPGAVAQAGWLFVDRGLRFLPVGVVRPTDDAWHVPSENLGQPVGDSPSWIEIPDGITFIPSRGTSAVRRLRAAWRSLKPTSVSGQMVAVNRRLAYRARPPVPTTAILRILPREEGGAERTISCGLRDISVDGARVAVLEDLGRGDEVMLELPSVAEGVQWHAVVVHSRRSVNAATGEASWQIGLRFDGLLPSERHQIERIVMELQRIQIAQTTEGGTK